MSAVADAVRMASAIDIEKLVREIERYLAAVDAFRAAGCSPEWRFEPLGGTR